MFPLRLGDDAELVLLEPHHAPELFRLADRNRARLSPYLPWMEATREVSDTLAFLNAAGEQFAAGNGFHAGIIAGGVLAGCVGMHPVDWMNRNVSLGYWIDAGYEGRGLVSRATEAVVWHCLETLRLHRVEIRCATQNTRSRAVAERLGFELEGILRGAQRAGGVYLDMAVYSKLG